MPGLPSAKALGYDRDAPPGLVAAVIVVYGMAGAGEKQIPSVGRNDNQKSFSDSLFGTGILSIGRSYTIGLICLDLKRKYC